MHNPPILATSMPLIIGGVLSIVVLVIRDRGYARVGSGAHATRPAPLLAASTVRQTAKAVQMVTPVRHLDHTLHADPHPHETRPPRLRVRTAMTGKVYTTSRKIRLAIAGKVVFLPDHRARLAIRAGIASGRLNLLFGAESRSHIASAARWATQVRHPAKYATGHQTRHPHKNRHHRLGVQTAITRLMHSDSPKASLAPPGNAVTPSRCALSGLTRSLSPSCHQNIMPHFGSNPGAPWGVGMLDLC